MILFLLSLKNNPKRFGFNTGMYGKQKHLYLLTFDYFLTFESYFFFSQDGKNSKITIEENFFETLSFLRSLNMFLKRNMKY